MKIQKNPNHKVWRKEDIFGARHTQGKERKGEKQPFDAKLEKKDHSTQTGVKQQVYFQCHTHAHTLSTQKRAFKQKKKGKIQTVLRKKDCGGGVKKKKKKKNPSEWVSEEKISVCAA